MINNLPLRNQYLIRTNIPKRDNTMLNADDYMSIGYMAGRFGINLNNPNEPNFMTKTQDGVFVNINSCTAPLFEDNLNRAGINFNRIA